MYTDKFKLITFSLFFKILRQEAIILDIKSTNYRGIPITDDKTCRVLPIEERLSTQPVMTESPKSLSGYRHHFSLLRNLVFEYFPSGTLTFARDQ